MDIRSRLAKLESVTPPKRQARTIILVGDEELPDDVGPDDSVIRVIDEETRQLVLRIIAGERT